MTDPSRVWGLLHTWVGRDEADLERAAVYTFHSAIARGWRQGRLLIAGDAAHQTPPFLGQGMCAGIRDAANLAWKIERVLRGRADDSLLDTYETERSPHVRDYIELAVRLGGLINTKAMTAALEGKTSRDDGPARMESIRPRLGPGLAAGQTSLTGSSAPQLRLKGGERLDRRVGYRFGLVTTPSFAASLPSQIRSTLEAADAAFVADGGEGTASFLAAAGVRAVAIRPDRHIVGAANNLDEMVELVALVSHPRSGRNPPPFESTCNPELCQ